jgi:hypothetical protein
MTDTIRLGGEKQFSARPVNHLPAKLDLEACLSVIEHIHPDLTAAGIKAAAKPLEVDVIDDVLEYTDLSVSDRVRFKLACEHHGILARGRRIA